MKNTLNLQPDNVFYFFEELSKIPHGSGNTKAISDYCVEFAKKHQLEYHQDDLNNVIIIKDATKGFEQAEPIIIQGHLDMVCEKDEDCTIDFTKDGLDLFIDGDFLKARGTTLGGDDAIAIAFSLALLEDDQLKHPRLEMIFTVDEETGMYGVQGIDLSPIKGNIMLNIDSDEEGVFLTSCAGGLGIQSDLPMTRQMQTGTHLQLKLTGLFGGHSGGEIHKERGNSNVLMGRVLKYLSDEFEFSISTLEGGSKDNAITRMTISDVLVATQDKDEFLARLAEIKSILQNEYQTADPDLTIEIEDKGEATISVLHPTSFSKVLFYLRQAPYGVAHMSVDFPNLVETSDNIGVMKLEETNFHLHFSIRSSVSTRKYELADKIQFLGEFLGATITVGSDYPAWEYKAESKVRTVISSLYQELFNEEAVVGAIHAGLECGYFAGKMPNLDAVSFGPKNLDIHTPQERLSITSVQKYWKLLVSYLEQAK